MFTDVNECNDDVCDANTNYTNTVKNIWKSYIWTADKDVNESDPRSNVHYLGSSGNKAWKKKKKAGLYGIWTHDLCDTGAALYQLSYHANWEPVMMMVLNKPVKWWING